MTAPVFPIECRDCYEEALMTIGIYDTSTVPRDKRKALKESYEDWFYRSHEVGNDRIVPA